MEHIVFIDESGNAGANLMDTQPIFSLAAIGLEHARLHALEQRFAELKSKYGFHSNQVLKGARIIKNRNNRFMEESISLLLQERTSIFASVLERRFMLAGLIVDNLLDPYYNSHLDSRWNQPLKIKLSIANHLYSHLSSESLRLTASALIKGNQNDLLQLMKSIRRELKDVPVVDGFDILKAIEGVKANLGDMAETIKRVYEPTHSQPLRHISGALQAPNTTIFVELLMRMENFYSILPESKVTLVFFSAKHFDQTFYDIFSLHKDSGPARIHFPGKTPLIYGFNAITDFRAEDTTTFPLLECADYLATGFRTVFELALRPAKPLKVNRAVGFFLGLASQGLNYDSLLNLVISDELYREHYDTLVRYAP